MMYTILINVCFCLLLMLVIYLLDYNFIMKPKLKKKNKKNNEIMEISYLIYKFKLDKKKVLLKPTAMWCSLINGFIISVTVTVISNIKLHIAWQLLIGFALVFGLIYSIYEIYGRHLVKKGWK